VMHHGRLTMNASVLGTPHYMSPEQARGETGTDARSDQHALGVILYESVVGCLPRDSSDPLELLHQVAYGPFSPPSEHMQLPDGLEAVIVRAMARDASQRFSTTREFGLALLPYASEASREYWSLELRYPSVRRSVDIAQPAVSSRRFTPGSTAAPSAPDASDAAIHVNLPEAGHRMLPSSRPPPPLLRPESRAPDADDPILEAKRSSKRKLLLVGGAIAVAAILALLISSGRKNAAPEPSPLAAKAAVPSKPAAAPPPPETASVIATAAEAVPQPSSARLVARVPPRNHVAPAKKAQPEAPEPVQAHAVATQEPSPKVRVIDDSKPKVQVIE
jgi:serine/threonine protein kinase